MKNYMAVEAQEDGIPIPANTDSWFVGKEGFFKNSISSIIYHQCTI
jgi:hypothetical protein